MLELIHVSPNWLGALSVALVRPPGVPERRHGEDPWRPGQPRAPAASPTTSRGSATRSRTRSPTACSPLADGHAVAAWVPDESGVERLRRLRDREVLEAAGFLLYEDEPLPRLVAPAA